MTRKPYTRENFCATNVVTYHTRRVNKFVRQHVEARIEPLGVDFIQYLVLIHIRDKLAVTTSEICAAICHDSGALTRIIDQMEERGWVARERSEQDRRRVEMKLTKKGEALLDKLLPTVVEFWNEAMDGFSEKEITQMIGFFDRLALRLQPKGKV